MEVHPGQGANTDDVRTTQRLVRELYTTHTRVASILSGLYFRARLQGITGDCLGATNQITEVGLYITAVILLHLDLLR